MNLEQKMLELEKRVAELEKTATAGTAAIQINLDGKEIAKHYLDLTNQELASANFTKS
jgi:DNA-binding protein YbaB